MTLQADTTHPRMHRPAPPCPDCGTPLEDDNLWMDDLFATDDAYQTPTRAQRGLTRGASDIPIPTHKDRGQ